MSVVATVDLRLGDALAANPVASPPSWAPSPCWGGVRRRCRCTRPRVAGTDLAVDLPAELLRVLVGACLRGRRSGPRLPSARRPSPVQRRTGPEMAPSPTPPSLPLAALLAIESARSMLATGSGASGALSLRSHGVHGPRRRCRSRCRQPGPARGEGATGSCLTAFLGWSSWNNRPCSWPWRWWPLWSAA